MYLYVSVCIPFLLVSVCIVCICMYLYVPKWVNVDTYRYRHMHFLGGICTQYALCICCMNVWIKCIQIQAIHDAFSDAYTICTCRFTHGLTYRAQPQEQKGSRRRGCRLAHLAHGAKSLPTDTRSALKILEFPNYF